MYVLNRRNIKNQIEFKWHLSQLQLERTPLHYAMGVSAVETISRILIKNGAKRVLKDLKGRQPSYYFMNRSDIFRLQEEEEEDELNA